jgi:hypothetical protein
LVVEMEIGDPGRVLVTAAGVWPWWWKELKLGGRARRARGEVVREVTSGFWVAVL